MDEAETRNKVLEFLKTVGTTRRRSAPINDDTELYQDLAVYGDDLYELVVWAREELGIKPDLILGEHAPGEAWSTPLRRLMERSTRYRSRFQSLTVGDILKAAKRGHWYENQP